MLRFNNSSLSVGRDVALPWGVGTVNLRVAALAMLWARAWRGLGTAVFVREPPLSEDERGQCFHLSLVQCPLVFPR